MKTKTKTKVVLVALCLLASHGAMAKDYSWHLMVQVMV